MTILISLICVPLIGALVIELDSRFRYRARMHRRAMEAMRS